MSIRRLITRIIICGRLGPPEALEERWGGTSFRRGLRRLVVIYCGARPAEPARELRERLGSRSRYFWFPVLFPQRVGHVVDIQVVFRDLAAEPLEARRRRRHCLLPSLLGRRALSRRARSRHEGAVGHRLRCRGAFWFGGAACFASWWRRHTLCFLQLGFEQSVLGCVWRGPRWVLPGVVVWL